MTTVLLERRVGELETKLRRMKAVTGVGVLGAAVILASGMADDKKPPAREFTASKITVVDHQGRPRIVLGEDPKDTQRRSRAAGITVYDD